MNRADTSADGSEPVRWIELYKHSGHLRETMEAGSGMPYTRSSRVMKPIAFLVAQHPAINHAVILREIRELRKHLEIRTASIRAPDRPIEELSDEERDEAARTHYIIPLGKLSALAELVAVFTSRPISLIRGLAFALSLGGLRPKQMLRNIAYLAEAVLVGAWMERNNLQHLHIHYSSTIGLLAKCVFPIEISISFHGPDEFRDPAGFWLRQKIEVSKFVRAISFYARSQLLASCEYTEWDKVKVAYMAVDPDLYRLHAPREAPAPFEIICVGRLAPVKAQRVLISAMAQLVKEGRDVFLHIVGGGPDKAKLEQHAVSLGIERSVVFHGFTSQHQLDELYRRSDIFALASLAEGLPGVLMEAMAAGIPCVSTWINGVPELIRDGIDGLLVPPGNDVALARALARLMDDAELRRSLAENGRRRIREQFHLSTNAAFLAGIFKTLAID